MCNVFEYVYDADECDENVDNVDVDIVDDYVDASHAAYINQTNVARCSA